MTLNTYRRFGYSKHYVMSDLIQNIWKTSQVMPRLHLPRSSYDLVAYDFFGIVGGYKLRRMCLHFLRSPYDFFRRQTRTNLTETLWISYDNRKVIVQSSCYLHDPLYKLYDARTMTLRKSQGVCMLTCTCSFLDTHLTCV